MAQGQQRGELRSDVTVSELVRVYALCERALIYDWCLSGVEYIQHVENCADIAAFYEKVKGRSFRYDNTALKPYYDELIEIIK